MTSGLEQDLAGLKHGSHVCDTHSEEDAVPVAAAFLRDGLARGECCTYAAPSAVQAAVVDGMAATGVDTRAAIEQGALVLLSPAEVYFQDGRFAPDRALGIYARALDQTAARGFTGLRGCGGFISAAHGRISWDDVRAYEVQVNVRFRDRPIVALCQYARPLLSPAMARDILRTHGMAVVDGRMYPNPYYEEGPDLQLDGSADEARVDWMLAQLGRCPRGGDDSAAAGAERGRSAEELATGVDVRDQLLLLLAEELTARSTPASDGLRALLSEARSQPDRWDASTLRKLEHLAEQLSAVSAVVGQARDVARLTNRHQRGEPEELDLADVVRQVALAYRAPLARAGCPLRFRASSRIQGTWDRSRVYHIVVALLSTCIQRGPRLAIDVTLEGDDRVARLTVRDHAAPPPQQQAQPHARAAVPPSQEAPPDIPHAPTGGFGVWIAREVACAMGGALRVTGDPSRGTAFVLELPRRPPALPV